MDQETFDALTRSLAAPAGTRRTLLRLMAGSALVSVVGRFGLLECEAAKANKQTKRSQAKRADQAAGTSRTHLPPGAMQTEGKGKGRRKGKGKHRHKPPKDLRPADPPCPDGQGQCADGACVPFDQCCSDQFRCADGSCVNIFDCCSDEKRCNAELCIKDELCCPDEKRCHNGDCIKPDECCSDAIPPLCEPCDYVGCLDGKLVCEPRDPCPSNKDRNPESCRCECSVAGYIDCISDNCDCHVAEGEICFGEGPICCFAGSAYCPTAGPGCCREGLDHCLTTGCCPEECLCPEDPTRCCDKPCRNW
jgi:hypothetical protein